MLGCAGGTPLVRSRILAKSRRSHFSPEADPSRDEFYCRIPGADLNPTRSRPRAKSSSGAAEIEAAGRIGEGEPPREEEVAAFSPQGDFASEASAPEVQVTSAPEPQYREDAAPVESAETEKQPDASDDGEQ